MNPVGTSSQLGPTRFRSFGDAYRATVESIVEAGSATHSVTDPASIGSDFGRRVRPFHEIEALSFTVTNPSEVLALSNSRILRPQYLYAQVLWVLAGCNNLEWIAYYNPRGKQLSDDDKTLKGAFGPRLRKTGGTFDQLDAAVQLLTSDPSSRRAIAIISSPVDLATTSLDVPCAVAIQFLRRHDRLDAIVIMRSQSPFGVMPYDVFLFSRLQAYVASSIGIQTGAYSHICGSCHIYDDELQRARALLGEKITSVSVSSRADPALLGPSLAVERRLRTAVTLGDAATVKSVITDLEPREDFFIEAQAVLAADAALRLGRHDLATHALSRSAGLLAMGTTAWEEENARP